MEADQQQRRSVPDFSVICAKDLATIKESAATINKAADLATAALDKVATLLMKANLGLVVVCPVVLETGLPVPQYLAWDGDFFLMDDQGNTAPVAKASRGVRIAAAQVIPQFLAHTAKEATAAVEKLAAAWRELDDFDPLEAW